MARKRRQWQGYIFLVVLLFFLLLGLALIRGESISSSIHNIFKSSTQTTVLLSTPTQAATTNITGVDANTGIYQNYYLGLVKEPGGVVAGNGCYGEFIVLINNKNAKNPTYAELLSFLAEDKTDEFHYQITINSLGTYFGNAEDQLDLNRIKNIIDGMEQPGTPKVCSDFAERLHNNTEMAGIRCGYVTLDLDDGGHALNVFNTTDKGLIYIDDTGRFLFGPSNCDKIVDLQSGKSYIPQSLFPDPDWKSSWEDLGTATNISVTWDGDWR